MKKAILLLTIMTTILLQTSCKKNDDTISDNELVGTTWEGEESYYGIYTFTSNTEYTFKDPGEPFYDGTYTFDGRHGTLHELVSDSSFPFEIVGDVMVVTDLDGVASTYNKK